MYTIQTELITVIRECQSNDRNDNKIISYGP